ncbi:MAG TPA: peptide ABC transporter substrate-binding protein, partial [Thermomicrobiales bacterium]|nr:peptide ABC transporter substrate-binding protein [Thermomicrobiales bacterium]
TLLEGLVWSDGAPVTSEDAKFTWEWVSDPAAGTTSGPAFANVADVEIVDERTFKVHLTDTDPAWYNIFGRGTSNGAPILPKHLMQDYMGEKAQSAPYNLNPVGTGPYKVAEFVPGDVVNFEINENYRFADKPFFKKVEYKGGGDAPAAARAVLQSGEVDYAINLQVEKAVLDSLLQSGSGELIVLPDGSVEHVIYNFADPNTEVDGAVSEPSTQHPYLSDKAVRQALALGLDRDTIVEQLYGQTADPTTNVIPVPDMFVSPNTSYSFDPNEAAGLLDEAGWTGSPRSKEGVEAKMLFQTTISPLRLKAQEIIKQTWDELGFDVELKSIDSSVFFSADAGNPDTWKRFSADVEMFAFNGRPFPIDLMSYWKSTPGGRYRSEVQRLVGPQPLPLAER